MEYRRFDKTIIVRLDKGEEILEQVKELALKERIKLASVQALGAVDRFTVGVFKTDDKKYLANDFSGSFEIVPFPVSWTVKMKKKQKETQDILSYHTQAAGCSDKARAKASGGRQPIEECGRTGL